MRENEVFKSMADFIGQPKDELTSAIEKYFYCSKGIKEYVTDCFNKSEEYVRIDSMVDLLPSDDYDWSREIIQIKIYPNLRDRTKWEFIEIDRPRINYLKEPEKTEEILYRLHSKFDQVFNYLFEYEYPYTRNFVVKNSGNEEFAREIFQEALTIILERIYFNKLDIKSSFSAYLYSVARNLWISQMKKKKLQSQVVDEIAYSDTEISVIEHQCAPVDNYEIVCKAIEQLGDSCRKLLEYFYFRNLDWQTIADEMGYSSPESARNQKYKCLERIKEQLSSNKSDY